VHTVAFANGDRMPALGLGTWKSAPGEVGVAVREALSLGYRHLDCAAIYGNEPEIGAVLEDVLAAGRVRREELWITSKLWNDRHAEADVIPALRRTLEDLRLDYLDLYLIHWPVAQRKGIVSPKHGADYLSPQQAPLSATWRGLEAAREAGLCRHIGVSNFSLAKLEALCETAGRAPELDQVELHPYLQQVDLLAGCRRLGVAVTAYSPLGSRDRPASLRAAGDPDLLTDPTVSTIAAEHGATAAQVLLAWAIARGTAAIPKSVHAARLRENLAADALHLNDEDVRRIDALERGHRFVTGAFWTGNGSPYTLANLWDS